LPCMRLSSTPKTRQQSVFYRHHGFMVLSNAPSTLILPLAKRKR
jgi:hypothetical protein